MAGRYPVSAACGGVLFFYLLANKWYSMVLKHFVFMTSLTLNSAFAVWTEFILPFCGGSYTLSYLTLFKPPACNHDSILTAKSITSHHFCRLAQSICFSIYCTYVSSTQLKLKSVFSVEYIHECCRDMRLQSLPAACGWRLQTRRRHEQIISHQKKAWKTPQTLQKR